MNLPAADVRTTVEVGSDGASGSCSQLVSKSFRRGTIRINNKIAVLPNGYSFER